MAKLNASTAIYKITSIITPPSKNAFAVMDFSFRDTIARTSAEMEEFLHPIAMMEISSMETDALPHAQSKSNTNAAPTAV